jgi:GNAT superfamily N-acetyltransferase
MDITALDNGLDFDTQRRVAHLYEGVYPIGPVLHQVLTGVAGMWMYVARSGTDVVGAGILKSAEAVIPVGPDVNPIAYAVSDMVTHQRYRRKGVGRALLRHMEAVAYRNGARILYLYTSAQNHPAIGLYEMSGWERLEDQSQQAVFVRLLGGADGTHGR